MALLQLGGIESIKTQARDVRTGAFVDTVLGDVRYAARLLIRNPIFTLTAALSLAIGIGATTTIFTVANGLLLRSAVGVSDPGRLVDITRSKSRGGPGIDPISYPDYLEVRKRVTTLEGVYGYQLELQPASFRVESTGAERVYPGVVTSNYFDVLGVPAVVGRTCRRPQSSLLGAALQLRPVWSAEPSSPIPSGLRVIVAGFLALLMSIIAVVLVIVCANLAGVLLARGVVRRREIAVRSAIGAGQWRVVRQLLTETTLLFAVGGIAGLVLARAMTSLLVGLLPAFPLPVNVSVPLDGRVVAFSLAISFIAALLCGLAPALHASKTDVVSALKDDAPAPTDRLRLRNIFVVAQVAFSVLLVITAAILIRDVDRVTAVDRGFDSRQVDVASVNLSMAGYTAATGSTFARQLIERVRAIPGVEAATLSDRQPDPASMVMGGLTVDGVTPPQGQPYFYPNWTVIDSQYFATLRVPLLTGRDFTDADRAGSQPVAILGETAAKRFFPGKSALGQVVHVHTGNLNALGSPSSALVVVGVARDVQFDPNLMPRLNLYVPMQQKYVSGVTILARTNGPASVADDIRGLVTSMNPNLPVLVSQTLDSLGRGPVEAQLRVSAAVAGSVGLVGLLLAAMGIYGVTAYTVARRTREIGIRLSLGAGRSAVVAMILRQGMTLVAGGLALGLVLSAGVGRVLAAQRFGVTMPGAATFVAATLLFLVVALVACYAPLRRAVRIGAMDALRYE